MTHLSRMDAFLLRPIGPKTENSLLCLKPCFQSTWRMENQDEVNLLRQIGADTIVRVVDVVVVDAAVIVDVARIVRVVVVGGT